MSVARSPASIDVPDAEEREPAIEIVRAARPRTDHRMPGLDGVRGVAVAAIVAYHLGLIDGGLLSVSVFFTLSGFLITSILLSSWRKRGALELETFWLRRARRLLPALFMLLPVVLLAAKIARPNKLVTFAKQAVAALFYVANWSTILRGDTYFNRFSGPGPFDHLWSLAIEEQFYAVWPLLLLAMLTLARKWRRADDSKRTPIGVIVVTALLAAASAACMALRFSPTSMNNTRAYEGTDARAAPILVGCLAAMILPLARIGEGGKRRRIVLEALGVVATIVVVKVVLSTDEDSPFLYRGGETVVALASAVLVWSAGHPKTIVGKLFGLAPVRWLGERTYGIYLWHLPVIAFMPASVLEAHPLARAGLQLFLILALAALSWTLLEDPVRRDGLVATFAKNGGWPVVRRWAGVVVLVPLATASLGAWPLLSHASASEIDFETLTEELKAEPPEPLPDPPPVVAGADPPKDALLTSCRVLVHVGDSTSLGLMSKKYLPERGDRLDAQYVGVGVQVFVAEISGARAIVERYHDEPSAYEIVQAKGSGGYDGCWVFALGNGDAATIHGNVPGLGQRIDWMMRAAGPTTKVLWTTTKTLLQKGPYKNEYLEGWNRAVVDACARHPSMRVYDYASEVKDEWYLPDKIHPNQVGSKERAARIARALAVAFPKNGPMSSGCVVHSTP